jgi:hypothetical protein
MRLDLHSTFASLSQAEDGMLKRSLGEGKGKGRGRNTGHYPSSEMKPLPLSIHGISHI